MNKEQHLEQVAAAIQNYHVQKAPPIFELFSAIVAMSISVLLFTWTGVLKQDALFYVLMRSVLPQTGWAVAFFAGGFLSAAGMITDNKALRVFALCILSGTFGLVATFFIVTFPNLASILMFWITVFTAISIPMVKYTGLRQIK